MKLHALLVGAAWEMVKTHLLVARCCQYFAAIEATNCTDTQT
jgi:hypothetical protein